MSTLRISDAPLLPDVDGTEKIPTGGRGDYAISVDQIKDHIFQDVGKELVGLGNVDNTSDLDKPVSTAQQAALNLKADKTYVDTNLNLKADKTNVYTRSETSLALSQKADLVNGVIPENQIPSSFNDVLEFTTANLPIIGEIGKIYVTTDNNKTWRWGGNKYVEISGWNPDSVSKSVTLPTYFTKEDGVDTVTGVVDGAYFNVRSESDNTVAIEYQNAGGVPTPTGKSYPSNLSLVAVEEAVEKIDSKLQREFLSVWDFFTKAEKQAYNLSVINGTLATFDCAVQLKAFFDYIAANDVGTAYCSGTFYTSQGILFGGANGSKTKQVMGDFHLCAIAGTSGHTLFLMQCGKELTWLGAIHVQGLGGGIFTNRTWRRGLVLGGQYQCAHTYINSVNADNGFSEYGVLLDNLTTASNIEAIRVTRCGSGYKLSTQTEENATWTDKSSFTIVSENIAAGTTQSTTLKMTTMPLSGLLFNPILMINGELYHVSSMDYATSQVTIFPLLNRNVASGTARYIYGAGVATAGGDASVVRIGKLNSTNCGVIYHSGALYPAVLGAQTGQSNTIDVLLGGNSLSQAHVGGVINGLYCEASDFNIVRRTRAQLSFTISTVYAVDVSKFYDLTRVRSSATNTLAEASGMSGIQLAYNGHWLHRENLGLGTNSTLALDVTDVNRSEYWHYGTSKTFDIAVPNLAISSQFGYNRKTCILMGTNDSGAPTGSVIFNAPAGYTVNGQPSVTFSGFNQAAKFDIYLQFSRNNFVVVCTTLPPTSAPSASATYDPPSIATGAVQTTTVTVTGVVVGDIVQAAFSRYNADIEISAVVSATNTVTVKFKNTGAAAVDLTSGTLTVKKI